MQGNAENVPLKAVEDLVLSPGEEDNASKESIVVEEFSGPNTSLHMSKWVGEVDLEDEVETSYSDQVFYSLQRCGYESRYQFSKYLLDPLKFRFRKTIRIMGLVFLFLSKLCKNRSLKYCSSTAQFVVPNLFLGKGDRFLVTTGSKFSKDKLSCVPGLVVCLPDYMVGNALFYYLELASNEVKTSSIFKDIG